MQLDQYFTPVGAVGQLLDELEPFIHDNSFIFDPSAGAGALVYAAKHHYPKSRVAGLEIDSHLCNADNNVLQGNFLDPSMNGMRPDLYLSNPPYSLALSFVHKMLAQETQTAILLRLSFLGSQRRHKWWQQHTPSALRILSTRPSFTNDGKTDNSEYAWFLWNIPLNKPFGWYK